MFSPTKIKILALVVLTAITVYIAISTPLFAQEDKNLPCKQAMINYVGPATARFGEQIDKLFQGEEPNSVKINDAMIKFKEYRDDLNNKFREFYMPQSGIDDGGSPSSFFAQLSVHNECYRIVDKALKEAQISLQLLTNSNSQIKKSMRLLNKYKGLNTKLHDLVYKFGTMSGQFKAFATKIPNWTDNCL